MPPAPSTPPVDLQLDWDNTWVGADCFDRIDHHFLIGRLLRLTGEVALRSKPTRALDVAAAEGIHTADLALAGIDAIAIDPSPAMLQASREEMAQRGTRFGLVRGIAETMPFRDAVFDGILCHGAIDHTADPALAVREMARVLAPDGRLVISGVNYEGLTARVSRLVYRVARRLGWVAASTTLYWDSPVPAEHSFECSYWRLRQLCEPYLEFDGAVGVSLGVGLPGWGRVLARLGEHRALRVLRPLDALAARSPRFADFVYTMWRPRPRAAWPVLRLPSDGGFAVQPDDVTYPYKVAGECAHWAKSEFEGGQFLRGAVAQRLLNEAHTGQPDRTWLDDLLARGPFGDAAVLGCDEERFDRRWLERGGSRTLDVYDLSAEVIGTVRRRLGPLAARVRFVQTDLNFAELPAARYDVIWSSGCLHHVVNLEHLLAQVERALRPGGLLALQDYVGERRLQFSAARLARINAILHAVPPRWRRHGVERIEPPHTSVLSPFCAVRPEALLPLAAARFDLVSRRFAGSLFPLDIHLDLDAIARADPALLGRIEQAAGEAARDPATPPPGVYAVFRKRS